jgi:hypothetical protein
MRNTIRGAPIADSEGQLIWAERGGPRFAISRATMSMEKITNIVVISAAILVVGLNVYDRLTPGGDPHQARAMALVGKAIPLPSSLNLGNKITVVLFVSAHCKFCTASMPFYTRISTLHPKNSEAFRLLAITPSGRETVAEAQQYLAGHHLPVDGIGQLGFDTFGIHGTPTLALVDPSGHVFRAWAGQLPRETEDEVVRFIQRRCQECALGSS